MKINMHVVLKSVQHLCANATSYLKQYINFSDEVDMILQEFHSTLCLTKAYCSLLSFFTKEKSL